MISVCADVVLFTFIWIFLRVNILYTPPALVVSACNKNTSTQADRLRHSHRGSSLSFKAFEVPLYMRLITWISASEWMYHKIVHLPRATGERVSEKSVFCLMTTFASREFQWAPRSRPTTKPTSRPLMATSQNVRFQCTRLLNLLSLDAKSSGCLECVLPLY